MSFLKEALIFSLPLLSTGLFAQDDDWRLYRNANSDADKTVAKYEPGQQIPSGKIRYMQDDRITLIDSLKRANPSPLDGYRVQLFFGSRTEANKMRVDFLRTNPETGAYVTYLAPNFRLRVGDFRTRAEAEKFKREIIKTYPGAYIVTDQIGLPVFP